MSWWILRETLIFFFLISKSVYIDASLQYNATLKYCAVTLLHHIYPCTCNWVTNSKRFLQNCYRYCNKAHKEPHIFWQVIICTLCIEGQDMKNSLKKLRRKKKKPTALFWGFFCPHDMPVAHLIFTHSLSNAWFSNAISQDYWHCSYNHRLL